VRDYLVQAARGSDGLPVGYVAWNIRRVECGLPWYGIDFSGDNFPQEARLGAAVSYTKGCFRGQETLARLEHRGHVNRLLVGLVPEESALSANERARFDEIARLGETLAGEELRPQATSDAEALEIRGFLPAGSPLYRAGSSNETASSNALACGVTTSAVYSFALRRPLVMAYVRREALDEPLAARTTRGEMRLREVALPPPQESANR
jgi:folate-binding protein YgfZ